MYAGASKVAIIMKITITQREEEEKNSKHVRVISIKDGLNPLSHALHTYP